jgi:thermostable 8-oxoguanine DNA glycosylase
VDVAGSTPVSGLMVVVAQLAEPRLVEPTVAGSSPVYHPNLLKIQIDPTNISYRERTIPEHEAFLMFCIMVAGRNADMVAKKLNNILDAIPVKYHANKGLFNWIGNNWDEFKELCYENKLGQYNRILSAIARLIGLGIHKRMDDETLTVEDLTAVKGIGPKTARFFLLHTRRDSQYIVLDTHMIKYLKKYWYCEWLPDTTPDAKLYNKMEKMAILMIKKDFPHVTLSEADLEIWMLMSGRKNEKQVS